MASRVLVADDRRGVLPTRLWTLPETARFLGVPVGTLYQLNHKGTGPRFHRVGRHCRYDPREVQAWLDEHLSDGC